MNTDADASPVPRQATGVAARGTRLPELSRFLPGVFVVATAVGTLLLGRVSVPDIVVFTGYIAVGLALPGTLIWRACGPALRWRVEEVALGTATAYAIEVLLRVLGSLAGLPPRLVAGWPVVVVAGFVLLPRLRRRRRSAAKPVPLPIAWTYAVLCGLLLLWFVFTFYRRMPVVWPDGGQPFNDLTFTLSLAGDIAHRWPPQYPYVLGEPLQYHWFYPAHLAAAHTATGIDLPTLLFRCALLPMLPVLVVGTGALATRLSSQDWAGPLGAFLAWFVTDLTLQDYAETVQSGTASPVGSLMGALLWYSPTQTYSAVLLLPAVLLAIDIARKQAAPGHWLLSPIVLAACAGAKGSALPTVIAGVGMVVGVGLLRRRPHWPAIAFFLLSGLIYELFAVLVYRGGAQGMTIGPFGMASVSLLGAGFTGHWYIDPGPGRSVFITVLAVVCFTTPWLGALLLLRRAHRADPAVWFLAGTAALGLSTMILLTHSGQSQLYFIRTAFPLLAAGAAGALTAAFPRSGRLPTGVVVVSIATGLSLCTLIAWRAGIALLSPPDTLQVQTVAMPYLITCGALGALATAGTLLLLRRVPARPVVLWIAVFALLWAGAGASRSTGQFVWTGILAARGQLIPDAQPAGPQLRGAQWLRDNSEPYDVFATNVQCNNRVQPAPGVPCSSIAVWVSAFSERRALVNSWGYTEANARMAVDQDYHGFPTNLPFWDQERLARSQSLIADPTPAKAAGLTEDYGVRWVYVDSRYGGVSPRLGSVLIPRWREGEVAVYEMPPPRGN